MASHNGFLSFIGISVFILVVGIWKAPEGYPAAALRAWLFNMLPLTIQDVCVKLTRANLIWFACVTYEWIKAAAVQLFFQITIFARLGFQFLGFFGATIYSWSLLQKPYVDTAVVRARGVFNSAKTVVIEMADISVQLHSRLEAMFGSTLAAYCVDGFLVSAVLLLLLRMSAVMITILYPAVDCLWNVGRRVYWRGTFLLFIASIVGYIGYLWTKVV